MESISLSATVFRLYRRSLVVVCLWVATMMWMSFELYLSVRRASPTLPRVGVFQGRGTSMEPLIRSPGFLIYTSSPSYEVGDVVIFESAGTYIVHRIVARTPDGFLTKGDGNTELDESDYGPVATRDIIGVVRFVVSPSGFGNPTVRP